MKISFNIGYSKRGKLKLNVRVTISHYEQTITFHALRNQLITIYFYDLFNFCKGFYNVTYLPLQIIKYTSKKKRSDLIHFK